MTLEDLLKQTTSRTTPRHPRCSSHPDGATTAISIEFFPASCLLLRSTGTRGGAHGPTASSSIHPAPTVEDRRVRRLRLLAVRRQVCAIEPDPLNRPPWIEIGFAKQCYWPVRIQQIAKTAFGGSRHWRGVRLMSGTSLAFQLMEATREMQGTPCPQNR